MSIYREIQATLSRLKRFLKPLLPWLGGVLAGVLVPVAIWWIQLQPTPPEVHLMDKTFEVLYDEEARTTGERPSSYRIVTAAVVYKQSGESSAGNCFLQPRYPKGSTFQYEQLHVFPSALTGHEVSDLVATKRFSIGGGTFQRRLVFMFNLQHIQEIDLFKQFGLRMVCQYAVSDWIQVDATTAFCERRFSGCDE